MQVDPRLEAIDPTLGFRDFQLLTLEYDKLLSNFGFNCNLRQYTMGAQLDAVTEDETKDGRAVQVDPRLTDAS